MRRSELLFDVDNRPVEQFASFLADIQVPGRNLAEIDSALQARFFQKKSDGSPAERWELNEVQVNCPPEKIREHLANCGFINETRPSKKYYDYAAWPGALVTRAVVRHYDLVFAWYGQYVSWQETIVFGGKRPLQQAKENYEACRLEMRLDQWDSEASAAWEKLNPQTELDMMRWIWERDSHFLRFRHGELDNMYDRPVNFVDAPMKPPPKEGGQPVRPTTEDTVNEWLKSNPRLGLVLLSSGAPYGMAMDEAFWMLLGPHGFTVETFGHAAPDLPIENFMREVAGCVNRIRRARIG